MVEKINSIFEINNISKIYESKVAIDSISLNIKKGEIVALIGPSGAGKTTLLNMLATVLKGDKGNIVFDGNNIENYKGVKTLAKKIGIIRQQFDLVGSLPVIHNVLAGRLKDWGFFKSLLSLIIPQEKDLAIKALERVGISEKLYEKTSNLSGGEQQRVAMARLLVQKPEVILADEPVSSLDPARAEDILFTLTNLAREEKQTLIASLHSVEYAKKYFNRIIALREGKIYFDLPAEEVNEEILKKLYDLTTAFKEDSQNLSSDEAPTEGNTFIGVKACSKVAQQKEHLHNLRDSKGGLISERDLKPSESLKELKEHV